MSEYKYLDKDGLIYYHSKVKNLLGGKVDKVDGKGLSTNDYTTTEKNKLNGIATGAEVNQNAFSNIAVGSTTIAADSKTDTLTIVAGNNITLTPNATSDTLTIAADAEPITIDSEIDSTSENPVQNKVIATALDTKIGRNDYAELNTDNGGTIRINTMFKTITGGTGTYEGCLEAMSSTEQEIWSANPSAAKFASLQAVQLGITSHLDTSLSSSSDDKHYPSSKCVYNAINDRMSATDKTNLDAINGYVEGSYRISSMHHPDVVMEWKSEGAYSSGSWVIHNNHIYTCIVDEATEGSFIANEWQEYDLLNWCLVLTRNQTEQFKTNDNLYSLIGNVPGYSTSTNYKIGDLVYWYGDHDVPTVYKCIENTSGTWDSTKWEKTGALNEIKLLEDAGYITSTDYATSSTAGVIKLGNNVSIHNGAIIALAGTADDLWDRSAPNYFASYDNVYYAITSHIDTSLSSSSDDIHYPSSKCVYDAINDAIGSITGISYEIVQTLPQTGSTGVIYLVSNSGTAPNVYDEYIWLTSSSSFEKIGSTAVDLSGYVQASEMVTITNAEIDTIVA